MRGRAGNGVGRVARARQEALVGAGRVVLGGAAGRRARVTGRRIRDVRGRVGGAHDVVGERNLGDGGVAAVGDGRLRQGPQRGNIVGGVGGRPRRLVVAEENDDGARAGVVRRQRRAEIVVLGVVRGRVREVGRGACAQLRGRFAGEVVVDVPEQVAERVAGGALLLGRVDVDVDLRENRLQAGLVRVRHRTDVVADVGAVGFA